MKGIFAAPASEETLINKETNGHFVPSRKNYLWGSCILSNCLFITFVLCLFSLALKFVCWTILTQIHSILCDSLSDKAVQNIKCQLNKWISKQ